MWNKKDLIPLENWDLVPDEASLIFPIFSLEAEGCDHQFNTQLQPNCSYESFVTILLIFQFLLGEIQLDVPSFQARKQEKELILQLAIFPCLS